MAFPTSPVDGQLYDSPNGTRYRYVAAGDYWEKAGSTGNFVLGPLTTTPDYLPQWDTLTRVLKNGLPVGVTPGIGGVPLIGPSGFLDASIIPGGTSRLDSLEDVSITYPVQAELLMYDGTYWENTNILTAGAITATYNPVTSSLTLSVNPTAAQVSTDTYNFNNLLSAADTDVQKALDTLDNVLGQSMGSSSINVETISSTKTMLSTDPTYQFITPQTTNRQVTLPSAASAAGREFFIKNMAGTGSGLRLLVYSGVVQIGDVSPGATFHAISNGSVWLGLGTAPYMNESPYPDVALGSEALVYGNSVALGAKTTAGPSGLALGYNATMDSTLDYGVALGAYACPKRTGELAYSTNGSVTNAWHSSTVFWGGDTLNATPAELYLHGGSTRALLLANSAVGFSVMVTAKYQTSNLVKVWRVDGAAERDGSGNSALVGTIIKTIVAADTGTESWDVDMTVDDVGEWIELNVTGGAYTVRWSATGQLTEVRF